MATVDRKSLPPVDPNSLEPSQEEKLRGYADIAKRSWHGLIDTIEQMHGAIASKPYDILVQLPVIGEPVALIRAGQEGATRLVYTLVRAGGSAALALTELAKPTIPGEKSEQHVRAALNGVFGDHLAKADNPLASTMQLVSLPGRNAGAPAQGEKLCLFVHGLALDESCWKVEADGVDFGEGLAERFGYVPLYLRYNSGLSLEANGNDFAALLDILVAEWQPKELLLIGHSMGGLLIRIALDLAHRTSQPWPERVRTAICLGSPQTGAPLERAGHVVTSILDAFDVTAPLGTLGNLRSQGIQDLRHGLGQLLDTNASPADLPHVAYRFLGGNLAGHPNHPFGHVIGDGLVPINSSTLPMAQGNVATRMIGNLNHMQLLRNEEVFEQISSWLQP